MTALRWLLCGALWGAVQADIYMHAPRGSNDRNCEKNANRNNGNRMFDSQNNAAGGYACPRAVGGRGRVNERGEAPFTLGHNARMYYYEGSKMTVEWTNQHGCGSNSRVQCQVILQYACEDTLDPYWSGSTNSGWPAPASGACPRAAGKSPGGVVGQCFGKPSQATGCEVASPRDGVPNNDGDSATDTIPLNANSAVPSDGTRRYGMHESYAYYDLYSHTKRNTNLWTADQNVRRRDMRGTRQNPNGNRRGLEIPEERDHYPWWHPTPWRDIAALSNLIATDDVAYCAFVQAESQNVMPKNFCEMANKDQTSLWNNREWPSDQAGCAAVTGARWISTPSFATMADKAGEVTGAPADGWTPFCGETTFSRTNQLGNAELTQAQKDAWDPEIVPVTAANRYIWTLPTVAKLRPNSPEVYFPTSDCNTGLADIENAMQSCVLRIRYNISTGDLDQWPDTMDGTPAMVTSANNSRINNQDNPNSPLEQDPYAILPPVTTSPDGSFLSFAVNTNQYSRTFQDRSYVFSIRKRPTGATAQARDVAKDLGAAPALNQNCDTIINVNLRGKRGNIVQTYPSVEYDFVPDQICAKCSGTQSCPSGGNLRTFLHFQWVGSDYNPRRGCNNGEGGPPDPNNGVDTSNNNARADRANIAFMTTPYGEAVNILPDVATSAALDGLDAYKASQAEWPCSTAAGATSDACIGAMYDLLFLRQGINGEDGAQSFNGARDCLTQSELDDINNANARETHPRNCAKLNMRATPYFDGGLVEATNCGKTFAFFSTRNNNFSNRDQTGTLAISNAAHDACAMDGPSLQGISDVSTIPLSRNGATGPCQEPSEGEANNNGAQSCIPNNGDTSILEGDTFTVEEADNDMFGDGNKNGCEELTFFLTEGTSVEEKIGLAIGLLFVGILCAWAGIYLFNRWRARKANSGEKMERTWSKKPAVTETQPAVREDEMI